MRARASELRDIFRGYLGIKEYPAGSNNVVFNTRYYGKPVKDTATAKYPWCVVAMWCGFQDAKASELFYGGAKVASCSRVMQYAIEHNQWVKPQDLKVGDLVIFDFPTAPAKTDHIGFVEERQGNTLVTLEGNTSLSNNNNGGEFMRRERDIKLAVGGFRPDYEPETTLDNSPDDYAKDSVTWALKAGLLKGNHLGDLMLHSNITRQDFTVFMKRFHDMFK